MLYKVSRQGVIPIPELTSISTIHTPWNWECLSIILELLEHNANPNYPIEELMGMTIIFGAIMYENESITRILVNHNADLNVLDDNDWIP